MNFRLKHLVGITLAIYFLFAIFLGVGILFQKNPSNQKTTDQQNIASNNLTSITLSLEEISKHSTIISCWMIVNNKVYDVTSDISSHPGGEATILPSCGKEATNAFDTKGNQGNSHSPFANGLLDKDYIGDVGQIIASNLTAIKSNSTSPRVTGEDGSDDDNELEDEEDD